VKDSKTSRRHFLRGAGGVALAIPFLPSLMSRAFAADAPLAGPERCFFALGTDHGGIWAQNMYPSDSVLTETTDYAGRTVRHGALPTAPVNGETRLSAMCSAPASSLSAGLAAKFNVLRGLDVPYRLGHHVGAHLGNFAATVGNITDGIDNTALMAPTIDQVIAGCPGFYTPTDLASRMTQRSFNIGRGSMSWNYTAPAAQAGRIVSQPAKVQNHEMFQFFFNPGSALNGVDGFIVDRVKLSYDRLRQNPRLSNGDRVRLDGHVERMAEIERKLAVIAALGTPPQAPQADSDVYLQGHSFPHNPVDNALYCHLMNDIIVAAFSSGISRVGTWHQMIKFADLLIADWHGQVAHGGFGADASQAWALGWNQGTFEHVMVDLAAKMDAVTLSDGSTLLDNSLIMLTQEAGQVTHHTGCVNYPVVTAGSAGGFFQTGQYVDFSDKSVVYQDLQTLVTGNSAIELESPGLYYNQFLGTALQSMGVSTQQYAGFTDFSSGEPTQGYGFHHVDANRAADYAAARTVMASALPVVT
jgi:hypothetical protein